MNKQKFFIVACHVLWRELTHFASLSPHTFNFTFLRQGLHDTPDKLRIALQAAIDSVEEESVEYDAVLVGYGLCSNGLAGIQARSRKLVIMRGHDCITFLLGSKQAYKTYFDQHPGTYWFSPGWIETNEQPGKERCERTRAEYVKKYGEDNADYLMEMEQNWIREYTTAAYVDLGFGNTNAYKTYTKECADWLNWNYDELKGDPVLVRDFVNGRWDSNRFLIVHPGETIDASNDDSVIKADNDE